MIYYKAPVFIWMWKLLQECIESFHHPVIPGHNLLKDQIFRIYININMVTRQIYLKRFWLYFQILLLSRYISKYSEYQIPVLIYTTLLSKTIKLKIFRHPSFSSLHLLCTKNWIRDRLALKKNTLNRCGNWSKQLQPVFLWGDKFLLSEEFSY